MDAPFRVRVNRTGRRTYSRQYKREIVEECSAAGASIAAIALSHGINANIVRKWIVQHRAGALAERAALMPVVLTPSGALPAATAAEQPQRSSRCAGVIEIELPGAQLRIRGAADAAALRVILDALVKR